MSLRDIIMNKRHYELLKEKTSDIILYLLLIEAMLEERENEHCIIENDKRTPAVLE